MAKPLEGEDAQILTNPNFNQVSIDSELLIIDASQLEEKNLVSINATYYINITSPVSPLTIWFIDNNIDNGDYHITLNGQPLKTFIAYPDSISDNWKAPNELVYNNHLLNFNYKPQGYTSFNLPDLAIGKHILHLSYNCRANESFEMQLIKVYGIVYMLKTSSNWGSFGGLNLIVKKPKGWNCYANLPLLSSGNQLSGHWPSLPSVYIGLTFGKPTNTAENSASGIQVILGLFLFALCSWLWGTVMVNRETQSGGLIFLKGFGLSFLGTCFFYLVYMIDGYVFRYFLGSHLNPNYGRTSGYAILAFPIIWGFLMALLLVIWLFYALISRLRK